MTREGLCPSGPTAAGDTSHSRQILNDVEELLLLKAFMASNSLLCPVWMKENTHWTSIFSHGYVIIFMSVQSFVHCSELCQETFFSPTFKAGPHSTHSFSPSDYFEYFITACCVCLIVVGVPCAQLASEKKKGQICDEKTCDLHPGTASAVG